MNIIDRILAKSRIELYRQTLAAGKIQSDGHLYDGNGQRLDITLSRKANSTTLIESDGTQIIIPRGVKNSAAALEHDK